MNKLFQYLEKHFWLRFAVSFLGALLLYVFCAWLISLLPFSGPDLPQYDFENLWAEEVDDV